MILKTWAFLLITLCTSLNAGVYNFKVHKLDNGLELIFLENHRAPLVMHMMCFKVGTNDSPWGKSGMAHYLEHLMFKGKPDSAAGMLMNEVDRLGGDSNAQTSSDSTIYYEIIPVNALDPIMQLDAQRMASLEIKDKWALPEIKVILAERHMRVNNTALGNFLETLNAIDIRHHPSRLPIIGWAHEIAAYTTKDAQDFYAKWYSPRNAFIIITGDLTFEEAIKLVEKHYGSIPSRPLPERLKISEPKRIDAKQTFEMTSEILDAPLYLVRYHAPTFNEGARDQSYALNVLEDLLGRAVTGRLTESLVEQQHLAAYVSVSYSGLQAGPGSFQIMMMPTPGTSLAKLEEALNTEIKRLLKEGVSAEEVNATKDYILSSLVYTQDDITQAAQNIAYLYACGMPLDEIEMWPERIKSVSADQINSLLPQIFSDPSQIIGRLLPKESPIKEKSSS